MTFPSSRPPRRRAVQRERSEQAAITHLLRSLGAKVYTLGTTRRKSDSHFGTMQTPGLPDLIAFLKWPPPGRDPRVADAAVSLGLTRRLLVVECKASGGRLRSAQAEFRDLALAGGIAHVVGGIDDVMAWLIANDYLKPDQVAHARVKTPAPDPRSE